MPTDRTRASGLPLWCESGAIEAIPSVGLHEQPNHEYDCSQCVWSRLRPKSERVMWLVCVGATSGVTSQGLVNVNDARPVPTPGRSVWGPQLGPPGKVADAIPGQIGYGASS